MVYRGNIPPSTKDDGNVSDVKEEDMGRKKCLRYALGLPEDARVGDAVITNTICSDRVM
jgi:hypothetical protein